MDILIDSQPISPIATELTEVLPAAQIPGDMDSSALLENENLETEHPEKTIRQSSTSASASRAASAAPSAVSDEQPLGSPRLHEKPSSRSSRKRSSSDGWKTISKEDEDQDANNDNMITDNTQVDETLNIEEHVSSEGDDAETSTPPKDDVDEANVSRVSTPVPLRQGENKI